MPLCIYKDYLNSLSCNNLVYPSLSIICLIFYQKLCVFLAAMCFLGVLSSKAIPCNPERRKGSHSYIEILRYAQNDIVLLFRKK